MSKTYEPFATNSPIIGLVYDNHKRLEDFEDGDIVDRIFAYSHYELREIHISGLDLNEFGIDEDTVDGYVKNGDDVAPIIFGSDDGSIIDGNHRANAANVRGESTILGYVGHRGPLPPSLCKIEAKFNVGRI